MRGIVAGGQGLAGHEAREPRWDDGRIRTARQHHIRLPPPDVLCRAVQTHNRQVTRWQAATTPVRMQRDADESQGLAGESLALQR